MDIYYSNMQSEKWKGIKIAPFPMLMAYYDYKTKGLTRQKAASKVILDSGAFSAYRKKIIIDIKKYIDFIKENENKIDNVVALDIFNKDEESYKNYIKMKMAGINCIPVFHIDADKKYLKLYIKETNYIGLGGVALLRPLERKSFITNIFREYPDPSQIGFHGFGISDERALLSYPWKSVDSRSAHLAARFGSIHCPWGVIRINPNMPKNGPAAILWQMSKFKVDKITEYFNDIGVDLEIAKLQNPKGQTERCKASIIYFEKNIKPKVPIYFTTKSNYLF